MSTKKPLLAKRSVDPIVKKIEACKKRIATERDKLRELADELNSLEYDCSEAIEELELAADSLSKLL